MKFGYRLSYFGGEEDSAEGLPVDPVFLNLEILDEELDRVTETIKAWIQMTPPTENEEIRHLHISILGLPEYEGRIIFKTPEEKASDAKKKLASAKSRHGRYHALGTAAKLCYEARMYEDAALFATELLSLIPRFEAEDDGAGNAVMDANTVLGRLALRDGKVSEAVQFLADAGETTGSPNLDTFGPNMSLAKDLVIAGEKEAVLAYFEACAKFWEMEDGKLAQWAEDVREGLMPDFGANLVY